MQIKKNPERDFVNLPKYLNVSKSGVGATKKIGILSFSDGRERVHDTLKEYIAGCEQQIADVLKQHGDIEVFTAETIFSNCQATEVSRKMQGYQLDACILNVPVFAFPNYAVLASLFQEVPLLAIAPVNGLYPGLGGLQAAVNGIQQIGFSCEKVWGNITEGTVQKKVFAFLDAAYAASRLKGQVYGLFGGRSIGMVSGSVNPDLWLSKFGVDVDHVDQLEILRRAQLVPDEEAQKALSWLENNLRRICYDGGKLTRGSLIMQIECYIALKELIRERGYSFVGVKCHYDFSEYYYPQCISAAFCNDPYDWDGPKEPVVFSCEADSDGALTMQVLKLISGKPVLFSDFRHFLKQEDLFVFCNCGACSTWYAAQSGDYRENLKKVSLCPVIPKYGGQGAHVQFIAGESQMTFARLTRKNETYQFQVFVGQFHDMPEEMLEQTCPAWPHGYAKVSSDPEELISRYHSNHIHAISGDYTEQIKMFCKLKQIDFEQL